MAISVWAIVGGKLRKGQEREVRRWTRRRREERVRRDRRIDAGREVEERRGARKRGHRADVRGETLLKDEAAANSCHAVS